MNNLIPDLIKSFNPNSKLWIFQSLEFLDNDEVDFISKSIESFLLSWESHGKKIKSTCFVIKSHFIFVLVDSNFSEASGCSIDGLFKKIQSLGGYLNKDFFKRNYIAFHKINSKKINFLTFIDFKNYIKNYPEDLVVFDNSISFLCDFKNWQLTLKDWKLKYFK